MFKKLLKVGALAGCVVGAIALTGCSKDEKIIVGTMSQPGEPILKHIESEFEEKTGYDLEIQIYTDFATPNMALASGEIDANLFQHAPFLETYNQQNKTDLQTACIMYDCAYGAYSKKITKLSDLPDGAKITIANDASNMKRCLDLLAAQGLIELDYKGQESTLNPDNVNDYIVKNDKNLVILPMSTSLIASSLDDDNVYIGIVNATFAINANLNTTSTQLFVESDPEHVNANILAARKADLEAEWLVELVNILTSEETDNFVKSQFGDIITPYHG